MTRALFAYLLPCRHSVCKECGVHFEPVEGYLERWANLCDTHRKPVMERDRRYDDTMSWAKANWERLDKMRQEEEALKDELARSRRQAEYNAQMNSQLAAMQANVPQSNGPFGIGGLG